MGVITGPGLQVCASCATHSHLRSGTCMDHVCARRLEAELNIHTDTQHQCLPLLARIVHYSTDGNGNNILEENVPFPEASPAVKCKVCPEGGEKVKRVHPIWSMNVLIKFLFISLSVTNWYFLCKWKF